MGSPTPPAPAMIREQPVASPRLLARFAALGIGLDVALNDQLPGAGLALFAVATAIAMRSSFRADRERDALLAGAVAFASCIALRASEIVIALDVLASAALFALAAARDDTPILATRVEGYIRRIGHIIGAALRAPAALLVPVARSAGSVGSASLRSAIRWVLIVLPILAVFIALLASADRVFGALVVPDLPALDLTGAASHGALVVLGALAAATLWLASRRPMTAAFPAAGEPWLPSVRVTEWAAVLGGLNVVFAIFVGVQASFLFGGQRSVDVTPGLTYAEYARSGFFQLIVVAALTALVILAGWDLGARTGGSTERLFRGLVTSMVVLTGVILASALMRLALYEGAFGFTLNRLAGYAAIAWIGSVLVILVTVIWTRARERLITLVVIAGLVTVFAVTIVNPERFVAERNLARFAATGKIDVEYLMSLGPDAIPVIAGALDTLPSRRALVAHLCERMRILDDQPQGWPSANLGRTSARAALAAAGITPATCP